MLPQQKMQSDIILPDLVRESEISVHKRTMFGEGGLSFDRLAQRLTVVGSPELPLGSEKTMLPELAPWVLTSAHEAARRAMNRVVQNGHRAYIYSDPPGSGTSTFLSLYARLFAHWSDDNGRYERILRVEMTSGLNTPVRFLDALAGLRRALGASMAPDRRHSSPRSMMRTIIDRAAVLRIRALIFDHIDQLPQSLLPLLADLSRAVRPSDQALADGCDSLHVPVQLGIIFAGRWAPEFIERRASTLWLEVEGEIAPVRRAQTVDDMVLILDQTAVLRGSACWQAGAHVGLCAEKLFKKTRGFPNVIGSILRRVGANSRACGHRLTPAALDRLLKLFKDKRPDVASRETPAETQRADSTTSRKQRASEKARRKDREAQAEKMSLHIAKSQKTPIM